MAANPQTSDKTLCFAKKNRFYDKLADSLDCDNAKNVQFRGEAAPGTSVIGSCSVLIMWPPNSGSGFASVLHCFGYTCNTWKTPAAKQALHWIPEKRYRGRPHIVWSQRMWSGDTQDRKAQHEMTFVPKQWTVKCTKKRTADVIKTLDGQRWSMAVL